MDKVFVLGLGAQKAGTSWAHGYLAACSGADFGMMKEYHVWDAIDIPECARFAPSWRQMLRDSGFRNRRKFQLFPQTYFDYFANVLNRDGIDMTGDITPSYSGLDAARLAFIQENLMRRSIRCKLMFLMRDPVERCWSAVRMIRRNRQQAGGTHPMPEYDELSAYARSEAAQIRTNYHLTIAAIEQAFAPGDIYLGFFETMMTVPEIQRFSEFFGVPPRPDFAGQKFNVSAKDSALPIAPMRQISHEFRQVYAFCGERFPEVRQHWRGFELAV